MVPLGQRFYPSECAFPLRKCFFLLGWEGRRNKHGIIDELLPHLICDTPTGHVANLLVRFALANEKVVPAGWAPRTLVQCGVAYPEIWDILHGMYESQVMLILPLCPLSFLHSASCFPPFFGCCSRPYEMADTLTSSRPCYVFTTHSFYPLYIPADHHVLFQNATDTPI